jgi:hypothetical protein
VTGSGDGPMPEAFYLPLSDDGARWRSTVHTTGPWDPGAQHGGPPSALLGRAVERCAPRDDMVVVRVTVEILGAVPVDEVAVRARVVRPGRSVELVEAVLAAGGRDVARASAWRVRRTAGAHVPARTPAAPPLPPPADSARPLPEGWVDGYLSAVEWREVAGGFGRPGPCTAWTRLRHPLVPGEEPSGLQRVLAVADSGNGLSNELPMTWLFINPELTLHLHREPAGEWVCVDAVTTVSDGGAGLATTALSDLDGPVGVGAQSLLVAPRPGA